MIAIICSHRLFLCCNAFLCLISLTRDGDDSNVDGVDVNVDDVDDVDDDAGPARVRFILSCQKASSDLCKHPTVYKTPACTMHI